MVASLANRRKSTLGFLYLPIGVFGIGKSLGHRSWLFGGANPPVDVTGTVPSELSDSGMSLGRSSLEHEMLNSPNSYVFVGSIVVFPVFR